MSDVFRFPNKGYDVTIVRKEDIIDSLDTNIDKDITLAIVKQLELDASNFIKEGRWTGIPFLGNMKIPDYKKKFNEINAKELLDTAKENLDKEQYKAFRYDVNAKISVDIKQERLYRYMTSMYVSKHRPRYRHLLNDKRASNLKDKEVFARFMCCSFINLTNYIPFEYAEE